jgi:hypothetical protein
LGLVRVAAIRGVKMQITGKIIVEQEVVAASSSGVTFRTNAHWRGGPLAKLAKELLKPHALSGIQACRRVDRSVLLLFHTRLRVIVEREHYLIVMQDCLRARLTAIYVRTLERLVAQWPRLFGWLRAYIL